MLCNMYCTQCNVGTVCFLLSRLSNLTPKLSFKKNNVNKIICIQNNQYRGNLN